MNQATILTFSLHNDEHGALCAYESGKEVPFDIRRVFTVFAAASQVRGDHAHKECAQLLVCVAGKIRIVCDNGLAESAWLLESMGTGLLVPPGIWAKVEYLADTAVLMVLCDRGYEEADYIRNYGEFKSYIDARGTS